MTDTKKPHLHLVTKDEKRVPRKIKHQTEADLSNEDIAGMFQVFAGSKTVDPEKVMHYQNLLKKPITAQNMFKAINLILQPVLKTQSELINSINLYNILFKDVLKVSDEQLKEAEDKLEDFNKKAKEKFNKDVQDALDENKKAVLKQTKEYIQLAKDVLSHPQDYNQKTLTAAKNVIHKLNQEQQKDKAKGDTNEQ